MLVLSNFIYPPGLLPFTFSPLKILLLFGGSVVSSYLWLHGLQHARLPCPSQSVGDCSNSCPLLQWYYPAISFSVAPFSSCPQSSPASGSFPMSWLFTSGGQRIGASALVLPMSIQGWFPVGLTGWISLLSRDSWEASPALQFESINSLVLSLLYDPVFTSIPDHWKNHSFDYMDLCLQSGICTL